MLNWVVEWDEKFCETVEGLLSVREVIIFKKTTENKALRGNSPQTPPHEGSTAGSLRMYACCPQHFTYI
jgi:hypothetical protein